MITQRIELDQIDAKCGEFIDNCILHIKKITQDVTPEHFKANLRNVSSQYSGKESNDRLLEILYKDKLVAMQYCRRTEGNYCEVTEITYFNALFNRDEVDIYDMKEDNTYSKCPYCGEPEPEDDKEIENYYEVNGKKYPFMANFQGMNNAYANCHYGVNMWWNEIHCCPKCKNEYYTIHEH